jgi:hypothetical protein
VQWEGSLNADAERLLAYRERLARPAPLPLEHDALEHLGSPAIALDDLEVDAHSVAGVELRPLLEDALLEALDDCAHAVQIVGCGC